MTLTEDQQAATPEEPSRRPRRGPVAAVVATACLLTGGLGVLVGTRLERGAPDAAPAPVPAPSEQPEDGTAGSAQQGQALGPQLSWAPPALEDPEVVEITAEDSDLKLDQERDYELVMPDEPLDTSLTVFGGRNVVLVGGEIRLEEEDRGSRGLYLRDQTGTVHVEGLLMSGSQLNEGINLDQREGATVQLQNIRVEEVDGSRDGHHADLIQVWAGPSQLLVDGFTGRTGYQGFFLLPKQFGDQPEPELFDLRRVDITGIEGGSAYMLWRDDLDWPLETQDVWVSPSDRDPEDREEFLWDREGEDSWADVSVGAPPGGSFVPEGAAGVDYVSPGYGTDG